MCTHERFQTHACRHILCMYNVNMCIYVHRYIHSYMYVHIHMLYVRFCRCRQRSQRTSVCIFINSNSGRQTTAALPERHEAHARVGVWVLGIWVCVYIYRTFHLPALRKSQSPASNAGRSARTDAHWNDSTGAD